MGCGEYVFVFPHPNYFPTEVRQVVIDHSVSGYVSVELLAPPIRIVLWCCSMGRTAMPKASVNENCNFRASKDNVSTSALSRRSDINSVSKTSSEKLMSYC